MKSLLNLLSISVVNCLLFLTDASAQRLNQPTFFEEGREQFEELIQKLEQSQPNAELTIDESIQQWHPITSEDGGFSVWVPLGILFDDTETIQIGETPLIFRILSSQVSTGKFVVAYADAPNLPTDQLFTAVKDALVQRTAFEITHVESITVDGNIGESLILRSDAGQISTYILLGNSRLYVVGVRQSQENLSSEVANRFLSSFQFTSN
ncbi:hypothetical protein PCC7418_2898 [Halothece sp. PCC 7418]|uniref:exodeoxyribonuclease VII small subunit n=1 Tax=Halothece sp. (strain PCC 7418) TaxID=65093 RepID=UPI0002A08B68|nr:exodeoxyribonuclease VII small subunit [Halothece sp. PCC 7418]AFZ45028.1 hypothetical protein PCC7418_2898 [Halothece sp. PCC 7418]